MLPLAVHVAGLGLIVAAAFMSYGCRTADQALFARAEDSVRRNEYVRAESLFTVYLGHEPKDADAWYNRALARTGLHDLTGAMADLDRTLELADGDRDARWMRFTIRELRIASLRDSAGGEGFERPICQTWVSALLVLQLEELSGMLVRDPMDVQARCERGILWRNLGRHPEAYMDFTLALRVEPADVQTLTERGNLLHALGSYSEALKDYDDALSECDTCSWLLYNKALSLRAVGRLGEAVEVLEDLVAADSMDSEAWIMLGDCRLSQGTLRSACVAWRRSAWLGNEDARARLDQHCQSP
jgi:tetratricopeptide (TPR) repeat protein